MTKTYSSKSNAIRGYLAILANEGESDLTREDVAEHVKQDADGKWYVDVVSVEDSLNEEGQDDGEGLSVQPLRPIKGTGAYKDVPLRRRTTDGGAVSWAWSVFDSVPTASRKEAIAKAVKVGIAFYTARTQYQRWLHRNDPKPNA